MFEPYAVEGSSPNRALGGFILIDKLTNATVACGMLHFALRRSLNIHRQHLDVSRETHAAIKGQKPAVLWFTGLSGAGKSTIANLVEKKLAARGRHTFLLDGDNVRHGLNRDLGFTEADRIENIRRVGEVARLMADAGLIVLTAFISPFRAERHMVRRMMPEGEFIEIFVDTPLAEAEKRDVKGLYAKARAGELKNFTGIDSPYEAPENAEIHIDTTAAQRRRGGGPDRREAAQAALTRVSANGEPIRVCNQSPATAVTANMKHFLIASAALLPAWSAASAQESRRHARPGWARARSCGLSSLARTSTEVAPLLHVNIARGTNEFRFSAPD